MTLVRCGHSVLYPVLSEQNGRLYLYRNIALLNGVRLLCVLVYASNCFLITVAAEKRQQLLLSIVTHKREKRGVSV